MNASGFDQQDLGQILDRLTNAHDVPGSSVCILINGQVMEAASGIVNRNTGIATTPDTVFQIGSVTKPFTATLAMQMVDEGKISLDAPIAEYLPTFSLRGVADAGNRISVRQILCHTSGIDGDRHIDTSRNDDCVEKLVALCPDVDLLHKPGKFYSYSNLAYNVLGRILEVGSGMCWAELLRRRVLEPLGLKAYALSAEEALRHQTAFGHWRDPQTKLHTLSESIFEPRSNGPSGTMLAMSARDLISFARCHMSAGVAETGEKIVSAGAVSEMQRPQVAIPLSHRCNAWGLGWMLYDWNGTSLLGHDGGTAGMCAFLRIFPTENSAIAILVNTGSADGFVRDLMIELLSVINSSIQVPQPPMFKNDPTVPLEKYIGQYSRFGQTIEITKAGDELLVRNSGEYVGPGQNSYSMKMANREQTSAILPGLAHPIGAYFLDFDEQGSPRYFHVTERVFKKMGYQV